MTQPTPPSSILIVEDNPGELRTIVEILREEGYDPVGCSTGAEALQHVKGIRVGIAVLELALPDLSGLDLLEQLRSLQNHIRVIINTRHGSLDSAKKAIHLGAFAYVEKTDSPEELLVQITRALGDQNAQELNKTAAENTVTLEEREERFRQLAEHIHEVFWLTSADQTHMYYVSPAYETIWGRSCASLYERPLSYLDAVDPEDLNRVKSVLPKQVLGNFNEEYRIVRPDGAIRWISARAFPIRNDEGEIYRIAGHCEDISDRKRAEEALKKTEWHYRQSSKMEALGTLAGGIAHDFNNSLTAILGNTELALATVPTGSRTHRNLQEVLTAGHRTKHLIQQILTFSRQSGFEQKLIQIHRIVAEAMTLLRATIPTSIEIRQHIHSESTVMADPAQIHQVIVTLCTNAEYAMRETGGLLSILLDDVIVTDTFPAEHPELKPGPHVRLTVQDTGPGLEPETLERMFDPFFTTKPIGQGSGMGLAMVHGIVTTHGGSISADSVQGAGTKIDVYLPTITAQLRGAPSSHDSLTHGTESILFVDDEEALVRLGKELLTQFGYTVEVRTSSVQALELFRDNPHRFDLVITDQTMPTLTGEALTRELLRIRPGLPIILCTGFSHTMSAEKAQNLGIRAYLMKPLAIRDLASIVRHVLDEQIDPLSEQIIHSV